MSAHDLLILLNELGKRDKMRGLPSILSLFRNELLWTSLRFPKIDKSLVIYRFYCMALFHSQTRRHMITMFMLKCHNYKPSTLQGIVEES